MKVLLVEDSPTLRHAMTEYIRKAGHECIIAKSGEEAVQIIEQCPVEMIIMDVEMPGLDGFETTKLIREMLDQNWIPIIFVTGKADDESVEQGIEAGGDDYLVKPVSEIILHAKIRAMERITTMRNELSALNRELKQLSQKDSLTQLFNRRCFNEKAQRRWGQATRMQTALSIILLDIDHFKQFNDFYGHPEGDTCIQKVASALQQCLNRPYDVVARYGGEEFIAILPNTPYSGAIHLCERIMETVQGLKIPHENSSIGPFVTASLGATVINFTTGTSLEDQIELADRALYQAKENGRNQFTVNEYVPEIRVLLVDDCPETLEVISENLVGHCKVLTTDNGEEALHLARNEALDLIILDIQLPNVNALDICAQFKMNPQTEHTPIFLISEGNNNLLEHARIVGVDEVIEKPFEANQLVAKISAYLH